MSITNEDLLKLKDFMFEGYNCLYELQYDSYHQFMDESIYNELKIKNVFYETSSLDNLYVYKYGFFFNNMEWLPATSSENTYMFPEDARKRHLTYSTKLIMNIQQFQEVHNISSGEIKINKIGEPERLELAKIPIMVKSKYCTTNLKKNIKNTECKYDPGCYFIINGNEKIVIGIERMIHNKILVFKKKDITYPDNYTYIGTIHSKYKDYDDNIQILNIKIKKDGQIYIQTVIFNDIPLFVFLRAFGIESDKEICEKILQNIDDNEMFNILKNSINNILYEPSKPKDENNKEIKTQEEAINFLITKLKNNRRFNTTEEDLLYIQKKILVNKIIKKDILPHMGDNILKKGHYLCLMINKFLNIYLERIEPDDRDSYINKRIDMPGTLMFVLFKQYYKKMLNDINRYFKKKNYPYPGNDDPINVINQIRSNTIEQGMKTGLMTGKWGPSPSKRNGVSQALQRYNYLQTISYLRRINSPSLEASTSKQTSLRKIKSEQIGYICPVETPEGSKVGLVKGLSLTASISLNNIKYNDIINNLITKEIIDILDIKYNTINLYVKVFLNGRWLGITKNPNKIVEIIDIAKNKNIIDKTINAFILIDTMELIIYTDGGRLIRPLLKIKNNKLLLTKNMIELITINDNIKRIKNWKEFLIKFPYVIDFVDIEKSNISMISMELGNLSRESAKKKIIVSEPNMFGDKVNRYNNTVWIDYSYCEIHPSLYLGTTSSNIPFCEHNQGPRNMFNFSQSRQAIGIYATNERFRTDISYRLMHPQKPLVITQNMNYLKTLDMPAGENCIVAIACYTGYNQEDSLIFNNSAIQRGLFASFIIKKYVDTIIKNPNTSQDDVFMKPDREKVIGMSDNNYDLLNEKGYVSEETVINNGDIIIGKVSPIKATSNTTKLYKDNSTVYKSGEKGVIDTVNYGVINYDGYEMCSIKVRSERIPTIGDKVCSRHGQKGTCGIILDSVDMPFTKEGIQPDLIINPNAIPSRMTIGQLLECLVGKVGALKGKYIDATPFNNIDIDDIGNILEEKGYNEHGYETLYCGMTGKKVKSQIFIGPTYYLRLKHLVQEKIHSRAKGPKTILTRQPPEGRSKDGGLRFGEMERDCMISHGMGQFLKERLVDTSDIYHVYVCSGCGLFASKMIEKNIYKCKLCDIQKRNYTTFKIAIPYAFKLLIQELQTINILPKIKVEGTIYNETI